MFEFMSSTDTGQWKAYGVYIAIEEIYDTFPNMYEPPTWFLGIDTGYAYNQS